jgi:hypothetical protein
MQLLPRSLKRAYAVQRQYTKALVEHFSASLCLPQLRRDAYIVLIVNLAADTMSLDQTVT